VKSVTKDELNTLVYAAFFGTFGKISFMTGLVAKIIYNHKDDIRPDILRHIKREIRDTQAKGWNEDMDKVWGNLLRKIDGEDGE